MSNGPADWTRGTPRVQPVAGGTRLLLVSRDARFVAQVQTWLSGFEVVALTEATTRHALDRESSLLDGLRLAVLDGSVSGAVRLRLYDRLRPASRPAAPVVFARSSFPASRSDTPGGVDLYLPSESSAREVAWWCRRLCDAPKASPRVVRSAAAGPRGTRSGRPSTGRALSVVPTVRGGYGWIAQAGLWGVAAALAAMMFWPATEREALAEALRSQVRALASAPAAFADAPAEAGTTGRADGR